MKTGRSKQSSVYFCLYVKSVLSYSVYVSIAIHHDNDSLSLLSLKNSILLFLNNLPNHILTE